MGMVCVIQALTERQIAALRAKPRLTLDVISAHYDKKAETLFDEPLCEQLDLDKCWDILRFLLLSAAGEIDSPDRNDWSSELLFRKSIGQNTGYGRPYLRSIAETQEFAAFLHPLTLDQLLSHFNCQEMLEEKVYGVWRHDVGNEKREREIRKYASFYYPELRDYVVKAAASQCGLLLAIC